MRGVAAEPRLLAADEPAGALRRVSASPSASVELAVEHAAAPARSRARATAVAPLAQALAPRARAPRRRGRPPTCARPARRSASSSTSRGEVEADPHAPCRSTRVRRRRAACARERARAARRPRARGRSGGRWSAGSRRRRPGRARPAARAAPRRRRSSSSASQRARTSGSVPGKSQVVEHRADVEAGAADERPARRRGARTSAIASRARRWYSATLASRVTSQTSSRWCGTPSRSASVQLGGADVHAAVELHRVGVDHLAAEPLGERDAEVGLADGGRADDGDDRRQTPAPWLTRRTLVPADDA